MSLVTRNQVICIRRHGAFDEYLILWVGRGSRYRSWQIKMARLFDGTEPVCRQLLWVTDGKASDDFEAFMDSVADIDSDQVLDAEGNVVPVDATAAQPSPSA